MGEMIKFGIKLALAIATAIALVAAIALLFSLLSEPLSVITNGQVVSTVREIFQLIALVIPIPVASIMALVVSLGAFKVAYWAADKMIQFISATS